MCRIVDWTFFALLGAGAIFDWRKKQIPILLLIGMSVLVAGTLFVCNTESVRAKVFGGLLGLLFFLISKCTNQAIGYGDSWIILLLGIHLGIFVTLQILFTASLVAGISSLFFLWKRRWKRYSTLPFVPFLAISYLGVMFL